MVDTELAPSFTPPNAEAIAARLFAVFGTASLLPSERDQNFRIDADGRRYVLKIAHPETDPEFLALENAALQIAHGARSFQVPELIRTSEHSASATVRDPAGNDCLVRMIAFLDGKPLADVDSIPDGFYFELGAALAELDNSLQHLNQHPAARRELQWDLATAPNIVSQLQAELRARPEGQMLDRTGLNHARKADILGHYLGQIDRLSERMERLPRSVIHNDANDYNILCLPKVEFLPRVGLIDFGDMVWTHQINELAIASAYCILQDVDEAFSWESTLCSLVAGYNSVRLLSEDERSVLFPLLALRLCQSVSIADRQTRQHPENAYLGVSEAPAWNALEKLLDVDPVAVHSLLSDACRNVPATPDASPPASLADRETILHQRQSLLSPSLSLAYRQPLHIVRGRGQYLYDAEDVTYLDCVNNVCHVGHCHPHVVEAAAAQQRWLNTNTRYLHENIVRLAQRLIETLPEPLQVCFFVNSGSEANDLALRLARAQTGHRDIAVIDHAYHGHTSALIDISPYKFRGPGGQGQAEHVHVLPMPDTYRGEFRVETGKDVEHCGRQYAEQATHQLESAVGSGRSLAGLFAEPILGCGGQVPLPPGYLNQVFATVRKLGAVCVADEVQIGLGRVGTHFWGFQQQGVVPDIVTMGKPLGNGHPLAAVVTTREIADRFANGMEYFNTFGGNPVSCAVGLAVLDVVEQESLQSHARSVGDRLKSTWQQWHSQYPEIGDVRGSGLFLGIEIVCPDGSRRPDGERAKAIIEALKQRRILLSTDGPDNNVLKFKPPLVFSDGDADRLLMSLESVLKQTSHRDRS